MKYTDSQKWNKLTQQYLSALIVEESQVEELRDIIRFHEWRYYVKDDPIITDPDYDKLFHQLKALETQNPELITSDSPTQRVGNDIVNEFNSVQHKEPMLSLDNSYNAEDLLAFDKAVHKLTDLDLSEPIRYVVEPKFDGGSVTLVYENDKFIRGATRGNGIKGEEITLNMKALPSIPLTAQFSNFNIREAELRGEALIRKDRFLEINKKRAEADETQFANPRNAATGGLRMKDPSETAARGITAFIYQLGYIETKDGKNVLDSIASHHQYMEILNKLGFKVPADAARVCENIDEVIEYCKSWEEKRDEYPYEIDGMVVKVDDLQMQRKMGSTAHHPRWAIAYKFKAKQATSILENVEFQVGKIGSITPVAKIKPVQLAGVQISSISLHNQDFINEKDLQINDSVLVERAGDVIPYIVKSFPELRDGTQHKIEFPTHCPECNHDLFRAEGEAAWRCVNNACPAQVMQRMIHFASKNAMDIDGMGPSYLEKFYALGWLADISDIYCLEENKIATLPDFGERSAEKLMSAIELSKQNPIKRLLHGLSIHHVGKKVASIIAKQVTHVMDLKDWTEEEFTAIKDIGPVVAGNIVNFFKDETNIEMLHKMESYGVNMTQTQEDKPVEVADDAPFVGKSILFTGSLQTLTRNEAKKLAEKHGARNTSSVSSKLDILVVGENAGSKLKKAQDLGTVKIMTEEKFLEMADSLA